MEVMIRSSSKWHDFLLWSCCVQSSTTVGPQVRALLQAVFRLDSYGWVGFTPSRLVMYCMYVLQRLHAPKFQSPQGVLITFALWQFSLFRFHHLKTGPHVVTWYQAEPADRHIQLAACFTGQDCKTVVSHQPQAGAQQWAKLVNTRLMADI